jgi:hypothetical protein
VALESGTTLTADGHFCPLTALARASRVKTSCPCSRTPCFKYQTILVLACLLLCNLAPSLFHLSHNSRFNATSPLDAWAVNAMATSVDPALNGSASSNCDDSLGPAAANCLPPRFDFTLRFEQFFLVILPCSLFLICLLPRIVRLSREPPKVAGVFLVDRLKTVRFCPRFNQVLLLNALLNCR